MTLYKPVYMQPGSGDAAIEYSAQDFRAILDALVVDEGVVGDDATLSGSGGGLAVSQRGAGANMSVDVAAGKCVITGTDVSRQGKYLCVSDATANVSVPAAPGSGSRTHRLIARVKDKLHNGSWTTYEWTVELLADTGSGTPAEPDSAITLATVHVVSGQVSVTNGDITMARPRARVTSAASGSWQTYTPSPVVNSVAVTLGTGGSAAGRYQVVDGKVCNFTGKVVFGSDASFSDNSAALGLLLPRVEANSTLPTIVTLHAFSGGTTLLNGIGQIPGTGSGQINRLRFIDGSSNGDVDDANFTDPWAAAGTSPANWRGKTLSFSGSYEIA